METITGSHKLYDHHLETERSLADQGPPPSYYDQPVVRQVLEWSEIVSGEGLSDEAIAEAAALERRITQGMNLERDEVLEQISAHLKATVYEPQDIIARSKQLIGIVSKVGRRMMAEDTTRIADLIGIKLIYPDGTSEDFMRRVLDCLRSKFDVHLVGLNGEPSITRTGNPQSCRHYTGRLQAKLYRQREDGTWGWFEVIACTASQNREDQEDREDYEGKRWTSTARVCVACRDRHADSPTP